MTGRLVIDYGPDLEAEIEKMEAAIEAYPAIRDRFPARWLALELLEDGDDLRVRLAGLVGGERVLAAADESQARLQARFGDTASVQIPNGRYDWINALVRETVTQSRTDRTPVSDRIDTVVTHRWFGLPIFLASMWVVFKLTVDISAVFLDWVDGVMGGPIARWMATLVDVLGLGNTWVKSLIVDGVVAGVGGILVFVPVLMALYLSLGLLEDSGYMARAAFVMDRIMRRLGLQGRSFLPMLVGFGCTVPAIYATRTLQRRRDRVMTGLLVPFMSCGARLPVYVLMAAVFFPRSRGTVVFAMYLLGILVALVLGLLLSRTVFRAEAPTPLLMELPPYRLPTLRSVWLQMWRRTAVFIRDAGTIILGTSLVVWLLMAIPTGGGSFSEVEVEQSAFGAVSSAVAPALSPAGFGSWEATGALITGFVAKEVVVSSMSQVYGVEDGPETVASAAFVADVQEIGASLFQASADTLKAIPSIVGIDLLDGADQARQGSLATAVRGGFEESSGGHGALAGLAFMVFVLLYTPCMAAVAAERHELGARWMWASILGQTALAWGMAVLVFQVGTLMGWG
ncbi:MAG: ferrous iron transport protein B [Acidimicrobiia bacterium]|nr:ferrous iron transport protein B [Acidimicrobiia bacterium]MDH3397212.1 ferrous iron transport protein B [Acidimicrobiia bacterium]MDH5616392.1 ferrous iron transport protein B [Acidimicrobiia bacterium]